MPRKHLFELGVVVVALVLLVALAALRASQSAAEQSFPSTYDTGANGYAALYDLLAREATPVDRFELPIGQLRRGGTLVIAGNGALDTALPSADAGKTLDRWTREGGRLIVLDDQIGSAARRALELPAATSFPRRSIAVGGCALAPPLRKRSVAGIFDSGFSPSCTTQRASILVLNGRAAGVAYRRGRGMVALFTTPTVFDNLHISHDGNAALAYALLGGAPVRFDERVYGYDAGASFWQVLPQPMRIAIIIAFVAAALAIAGANLPFAPPYAAGPPDERDSGEYIESVARMLERGGASHEAVMRIAARCERVLSPRAGSDERARMLLRELRILEATPRPGPHDVLQAGRIFARVQKEYGC